MTAIDRARDGDTFEVPDGDLSNPAASCPGRPTSADRSEQAERAVTIGAGRGLAIAGIVVGIAGIVFTVLLSVASLGAAMLLVGLVIGGIGGVLFAPSVGRCASRLSLHLDQRRD